jgi:hypothetical protein
MALLSMRQYAKHRGVSVEAVSKAVKTGRIKCERDSRGYAQIDPIVADREWDGNSDPNKVLAANQSKPDAPEDAAAAGGPSLHKSAAVLKAYQARLAKLEFDEKTGKVHDVEQCKRDAFKAGRSVRDALLGIPDRLSAELAGETDQFTVRQKLDAEIRQALGALASDLSEISG